MVHNAKNFKNLLTVRAKEDRETAEHARVTDVHGSLSEEITERFTKLADECDKDIARIDHLLERIEVEGLPEEVENYMPEGL